MFLSVERIPRIWPPFARAAALDPTQVFPNRGAVATPVIFVAYGRSRPLARSGDSLYSFMTMGTGEANPSGGRQTMTPRFKMHQAATAIAGRTLGACGCSGPRNAAGAIQPGRGAA